MAEYNLSEIMIGILRFFPYYEFKNDRETIHRAFYEIRERHYELLKDFLFRQNILFHRSKILDDILSSLQPGILNKTNPSYDTYRINGHVLEKRWGEVKEKLKNKIEELQIIGKKLGELLA